MAHAPSRFLSLPGELRNRIYEFLLLYTPIISQESDYVNPYTFTSIGEAPCLSYRTGLHPEILGTSSIIAFEALPILYAKNRFAMWATEATCFTRMIGRRNAGLLKVIILFLNGVDRLLEQLKLDQVFEHGATLKHLNVSIGLFLEEKMLDKHQQSVHDFLCRAQQWLAAHPSLTLAMSPYPTGQCRRHSFFTALEITFVATQEDYYTGWDDADDPVVVDLNATI